ncbi:MAG: choline ABC transporter ATP-binding protein [Hyphomicrobium sp.]|uniref:choline ABC transporter ATP-binding protein n=1 Tax=Hyphomicrobium sp. TaxID=82 RepID=UPI0039E5901C
MSVAVDFKNVDIIFGKDIPRVLAMVDAGDSRAEILSKTGAVLGAAGANLTVNEGEISVLMGLSGSGKSTLLRAVNGLNKVSRGSLLVKDGDRMVDIASCDAATLRHMRQNQVAMVFQQFALLPWRTVRENAGLGLELAGVPPAELKERVDRQLHLVGLDSWANKYVHELSGGMQQRVGLARAFATDAPILLMDEPFSALDPLIRTKLQDELLQLQKTIKKTIIFVSHDLEEALKIGNRITIMESGRIVQSGAPEDIVLQPADDYVRDFIANVNPLSVLTAWNVMRTKHDLIPADDNWIWLDSKKTTKFRIDDNGTVIGAECEGRSAQWVSCSNVEDPLRENAYPIYWARPGTSLKTVILAMHKTAAAPVALFDDSDRFVGAISVPDVLQAILRRSD